MTAVAFEKETLLVGAGLDLPSMEDVPKPADTSPSIIHNKYKGQGYVSNPEITFIGSSMPESGRRQRLTLSVTQIEREGSPLVWINVKNPNRWIMNKLSEKYNVKVTDLEQSLDTEHPPTSYRYRNYLVCHLEELKFETSHPQAVQRSPISAILNDDFIITFTKSDVRCTERVRTEMAKGDLNPKEVNSSNYLFSRIVGSALHYGATAMADFENQTQAFCDKEALSLPEEPAQAHVRSIRKSISEVKHSLQRYSEILSALKEEQNLFGAKKSRDAIGRYEGVLGGARESLSQASDATSELRKEWKERTDEWRNDSLDRLTYLSAAVLIPALTAQILSIDFSGSNFSFSSIITSLATSALVSAYLVGIAIVKKRALQMGPNNKRLAGSRS